MAITVYNLKKWILMLSGKSIHHVNQDEGKVYSRNEIRGYYNNLMDKVNCSEPTVIVPKVEVQGGKWEYFPIAIFQFGLGAYDLFLQTGEKEYLEKFKANVEWAVNNQAEDGSWKTFSFIYPETPFSAMAQGEGISLLLRAYMEFKDEIYLNLAQKALDFMLRPVQNGGTTRYDGEDVYFMEFTNCEIVLNGWIFALFGLIDYLKVKPENSKVQEVYKKTVQSMLKSLEKFDCGYWSIYRADGLISSPFYHKLHIAQLRVLHELTDESLFGIYAEKWSKYEKNKFYRIRAFVKKAVQKIGE